MLPRHRYLATTIVVLLVTLFTGRATLTAAPCVKAMERDKVERTVMERGEVERAAMERAVMERVEVEAISRVTHLSTSGANLWVVVRNDSGARLVIKSGELDILVDGEVRATIALRDKVVIRRRSHDEVLLPLRFRSRNTLALASLLRSVVRDVWEAKGDISDGVDTNTIGVGTNTTGTPQNIAGRSGDGITISLRVRGGTALFKRTVELEGMTLGEALNTFGISRDMLAELERLLD